MERDGLLGLKRHRPKPGVGNLDSRTGAAAFGQSLGHARQPPGQRNSDRTRDFEVSTPHSRDGPDCRATMREKARGSNGGLIASNQSGDTADVANAEMKMHDIGGLRETSWLYKSLCAHANSEAHYLEQQSWLA